MPVDDDELERLDPRKRRTRVALHAALEHLLEQKDFESISVSDISEAADLNRATFYAHFPDKFALLECMFERRFNDLLERRNVSADDGCATALDALTRALAEFLAMTASAGGERRHQLEPHLEAAVIGAVRQLLLAGLARHAPSTAGVSPEMIATTASWAMYGAVKEWSRQKRRGRVDDLVRVIAMLVVPIFEPGARIAS